MKQVSTANILCINIRVTKTF